MTSPNDRPPEALTEADFAKAELGVYTEAIQPLRETVQREIGTLSMEHALLEAQRRENAAARANVALIREFTGHLPLADYDQYSGEAAFTVDDFSQARALQSKVVWWREFYPDYVIGERPGESHKWVELLLIDAGNAHNIRHAVVQSETYKKNKELAEQRESHPFDERAKQTMLDPATGKLSLTHAIRGSVDVEKVKRTLTAFWEGVPHSVAVGDAIPDEMMSSFEVYNHLYKLAADLGQEKVLNALLTKQPAAATKKPSKLTKLLGAILK